MNSRSLSLLCVLIIIILIVIIVIYWNNNCCEPECPPKKKCQQQLYSPATECPTSNRQSCNVDAWVNRHQPNYTQH